MRNQKCRASADANIRSGRQVSLETEAVDHASGCDASEDPLAALLAATAGGDEDAFARLYRQSSGRLLSIALRMLRRRDAAEEVLQEAYLQVWNNAAQFTVDKGSGMGWLIGILLFRALDRLRRDSRSTRLASELVHDGESLAPAMPPDPAERTETLEELTACLGKLERRQQDCILLAYCEGYSHDELAGRFDCPLGTIKSWIRRGVIALKECLDRA